MTEQDRLIQELTSDKIMYKLQAEEWERLAHEAEQKIKDLDCENVRLQEIIKGQKEKIIAELHEQALIRAMILEIVDGIEEEYPPENTSDTMQLATMRSLAMYGYIEDQE